MASKTSNKACSKGLDAGTDCKQKRPNFKEKSCYPDFLYRVFHDFRA